MGKTKIKTIDDSSPEKEVKEKKKLGRTDDLVEKLKAELETGELRVDTRSSKLDKEAGGPKTDNQVSSFPASRSEQPQIPASSFQSPVSKSTKPGKIKPRSKKYQQVSKDLDKAKSYPLSQAIDMVKKLSYSKFNGTLEAHINTVQTGIRGLVSLPFASGRKLRILAFGPASSKDLAGLEDITIGTDETIEQINKGKLDFDLVVTTPQWMPKLAKVARILGPRGLMPNPKNGTITDDLKKGVAGFQSGKTEYKTEPKAPVIHLGLGKLDQPDEELIANIKTLLQTLGKTRVKKVSLSPTMGPSVKVDLASV